MVSDRLKMVQVFNQRLEFEKQYFEQVGVQGAKLDLG